VDLHFKCGGLAGRRLAGGRALRRAVRSGLERRDCSGLLSGGGLAVVQFEIAAARVGGRVPPTRAAAISNWTTARPPPDKRPEQSRRSRPLRTARRNARPPANRRPARPPHLKWRS